MSAVTTPIHASVAEALLLNPVVPLAQVTDLAGAGVYAIYYTGDFEAYRHLALANRDGKYERPIYVGKAVSPGARKGNFGVDTAAGPELFKRLGEHAASIVATSLKIEDFACRYLVVDDIWIPLGEALLIARFSPIWNRLLDGFGNHNPGAGRISGMMPRWDVLHPGRSWAPNYQPRPETAAQLNEEVKSYLAVAPEPVPHMLTSDEPNS